MSALPLADKERDVDGALYLAEDLLLNLDATWLRPDLAAKQRLQEFFFPDGLVLGKEGIRTPVSEAPVVVVSAVPRLSRLMALAIRMQELVDAGEVADYAKLARLTHVSRARITQIMNLLLLAPDIQEALLFLPRTDGRQASISERQVRSICAVRDWGRQRRVWGEMVGCRDSGTGDPVHRTSV